MPETFLETDASKPLSGLFITAVGTGIGKTLVTTILCHQLKSQGRSVAALKPVISGFLPDDTASDPALIVRSLGGSPTPAAIAAIAPWRFAHPIAPHLAARLDSRPLSIGDIARFCGERHRTFGGLLLVEGAGGVMTPIDDEHTFLDLIALLGFPVVLVTGSYLGALSHTLTALYALRGSGVTVRAVVVSESADSVGLIETTESLRTLAGAGVFFYPIPRLAGDNQHQCREAPDLTGICELEIVRSNF